MPIERSSMLNRKILSSILIVCAVGLLLVIYFSAYVALAERDVVEATSGDDHSIPTDGEDDLYYTYPWEARLFAPAAKIESVLRNKTVITSWFEPG